VEIKEKKPSTGTGSRNYVNDGSSSDEMV